MVTAAVYLYTVLLANRVRSSGAWGVPSHLVLVLLFLVLQSPRDSVSRSQKQPRSRPTLHQPRSSPSSAPPHPRLAARPHTPLRLPRHRCLPLCSRLSLFFSSLNPVSQNPSSAIAALSGMSRDPFSVAELQSRRPRPLLEGLSSQNAPVCSGFPWKQLHLLAASFYPCLVCKVCLFLKCIPSGHWQQSGSVEQVASPSLRFSAKCLCDKKAFNII